MGYGDVLRWDANNAQSWPQRRRQVKVIVKHPPWAQRNPLDFLSQILGILESRRKHGETQTEVLR